MNPAQTNKTDSTTQRLQVVRLPIAAATIRYAAMAPKAVWRKAGVVCLHRFSMPVMGSKEVRFG